MTASGLVHIKLSDSGWILEKMARELCARLPYVSYGREADARARIQYYLTYGCRGDRVSPVEIGFFTHREREETARAMFDKVALEVDVCVAQADTIADIVRTLGAGRVEVIAPGVDLEAFYPLVRIGVVGRTYGTGRKGEDLVAAVMDIPGVEWHFTGEGWPGPSRHVPDEEMPGFYQSLDFVLVPSYDEGGPMCVLEALACGCAVIAPEVGWVPQFPHKSYRTGDIADLRCVIRECVEQKQALRQHVLPYSWDAWARKHHALFTGLLGFDPTAKRSPLTPDSQRGIDPTEKMDMSVTLVTHGGETESGIGGPSVRVPRTVEELCSLGVRAESMTAADFSPGNYDVVHVFNVWPAPSCENLLARVAESNSSLVFSPIFLDLSELTIFESLVPRVLADFERPQAVVASLAALKGDRAELGRYPDQGPIGRYQATIRRLTSYADHLILLSEHERKMLSRIGVDHPSTSVVRNTADAAATLSESDPELFAEQTGVRDYVLCVGRIERRKNQAMLAFALRGSGIPLVLVGRAPDPEYAELVRKIGGNGVVFAGHLPANGPMLASAYAGARVFCLPSWVEGASLAALEAEAAGCPLVLSNRASEQEYFGSGARYVDPLDPESIRDAVLGAFSEGRGRSRLARGADQQIANVWPIHARETLAAYRRTIDVNGAASFPEPGIAAGRPLDMRNTVRWCKDRSNRPPPVAHLQSELANKVVGTLLLNKTESDWTMRIARSPSGSPPGQAARPAGSSLTSRPMDQLIRLLHQTAFPADGFSSGEQAPPHPWLTGPPDNALARYAFAAQQIGSDSHVLDLSSGPGYGPYLLADMSHCNVDAYDESPASVAYAKRNWRHRRVTHREDLRCRQCGDGARAYDHILAFFSPALINTPVPFLKDALRGLKPSGSFFFTLPFGHLCRDPMDLLERCQVLDAMVNCGGRLEVFSLRGTVVSPLKLEGEEHPADAFLGVWRLDANEAPDFSSTAETFTYLPKHGEIKSVRQTVGVLLALRWSSLAEIWKVLFRRREWCLSRITLVASGLIGVGRKI